MLKLWGRRSSINVQKVIWTLRELGIDHLRLDAGGEFGGLEAAEFRARNPHGRIPVIDDEGVVVWESNAIVRFLCARYSLGELWPESAGARAQADQWMDWCATSLQPAFMDFFWNWYRTPETQRDAARNADRLARAHRSFSDLDKAVAGQPFLSGTRLTMGDIPAGAMLYRYFTLEIARPRLRHLEAWYAGLCERQSYRDSVMTSYDDLKGRLAF